MTQLTNTILKGQQAETIACHYLMEQGCHIIERNYRQRMGEIDIIAQEKSLILFIEVKYRTKKHFGLPAEGVTLVKQQKIIKTARYYLHTKKFSSLQPCRFDIVGLYLTPDQDLQIDWYKNAFQAEESL